MYQLNKWFTRPWGRCEYHGPQGLFCVVQYVHDKCHIKYYLCNNCTQTIGFILKNCYDWVRKGEVRWEKEIKR